MAQKKMLYRLWRGAATHTFTDLRHAVMFAREWVQHGERPIPVVIWDDPACVVIGVVTDDANGVVVHRLKTWPEWEASHVE
jgi:hypothetical protein